MLAGVMDALASNGLRYPDDMSLVCIGDTDLARHATPGISALTWDLDQMGRVAANVLLDRIRGGDEARKVRPVYLPTRFILRHSGARPRAPDCAMALTDLTTGRNNVPATNDQKQKATGIQGVSEMKLRAIMLSLLALASVACSAHAEDAADYPSKKIKMLLPFGAGGGGDVLGRLLADRMGNRLRADHLRRKPNRRRRHHRRAAGGGLSARRLHHHDRRHDHPCARAGRLSEPAL